MPGYDGTGPRGQGPMTGRGEGYCAIEIAESGEVPRGYAGLQGIPVRQREPWLLLARWRRFIGRTGSAMRLGRASRRRRGRS